jgi:ABC-2 type transport system ATP-binding protein
LVVPGLPASPMKGNAVIEVENLSKRYGDKLAVDGLDFVVHPGIVTGFLGPNGAGKSTTMRMVAGLDAPTAGRVRVSGQDYRAASAPMAELGILLEARSVHTGRSARNHLLALAQTNGVGVRRVDEVIDLVGLGDVAGQRVGGFSLGMGQRLGIASALLGDPETVVLDEPINGLDPEGIHWIRELLRSLAAEGRTVFLSSHLMSEMALTAEHLIIVGRGRLIRDVSVADFVRDSSKKIVRVRSPQAADLRQVVLGPDVRVSSDEPSVLEIEGLTADQIGQAAADKGFVLYELTPQQASLEEAFMELTRDDVEYRTGAAPADPTSDIDKHEGIAA